MNNNKAARILNFVFSFLFTSTFLFLLYQIIIKGYQYNEEINTYRCNHEEYIIIIVSAFVLSIIFAAVYYAIMLYNSTKIRRRITDNDQLTKRIIFAVVAVMLILQMFCAYFLVCTPVTDLDFINRYARDFAYTGNFDLIQKDASTGSVYMIRYPNNLALMFIISFIYRIDYLITGYISNYIASIFNTVSINASVLMTALLVRRLFGNKRALMTLFLCVLFMPFYTFTPYYYTDSISIPFFTGSLCLFFAGQKSETKYKKYVLTALSGVVIMLGYKIKASILVVLVVLLIYLILKCNLKRFGCFALALIIGFGSTFALYTTAYRASGIITKEQEYLYEYPFTHWIMMGLKGYGHYNTIDSYYTESFEGKDAKTKATLEIIQGRLEKRKHRIDGVDDMLTHLEQKAVWTWEDGTYYIAHHIENPLYGRNILHEFVLNDGIYHFGYYTYCCGFQLFLIAMMAVSAFGAMFRRRVDEHVVFRGVVFAIFVFLLIWETRSRYLYNFTPAFIILAVDGLATIKDGVDFVISKIKAGSGANKKHRYRYLR